jgi:hypothetical protein
MGEERRAGHPGGVLLSHAAHARDLVMYARVSPNR